MSKKLAVLFAAIFLIAVGSMINQPVQAQSLGSIYIQPDGSVVGTNSIQRNGDVYTFTGNISGGIAVRKSNIVIDGAGYTLEGNGQALGIDLTNGVHQDPSREEIHGVTVKNMRIIHWERGIDCSANYNNTIIGNYIANCEVQLSGSNNTLRHNTILSGGVLILYSGINVITENSFINSGLFVGDECPEPIVDRNYWSDYLTKYPNAKEIDNTGIWDTPYTKDNYGGRRFTDNHPLIEPVSVIPEFPSWTILPLFFVTVFLAVVFTKLRIGRTQNISNQQHKTLPNNCSTRKLNHLKLKSASFSLCHRLLGI